MFSSAACTRLRVLIALAITICSLGFVAQAGAHAALISSVPADGSIIAVAPKEFSLTFNEPVSPLVLKLVRPEGSATPLDSYTLQDATVVIEVPRLGEGTHVLSWRVVSADGHPVGGSLVFSIGASSASAPPSVDVPASRSVLFALWIAKVGLYAGLFFGVGGAFFLAWVGPATGRVRGFVRAALAVGLLATPIAVGLQGLDALELPLSAIASPSVWQAGFGTSFGNTALIAAVSFAAAFITMAVRAKALRQPLAAAALAGVGLALAASGHAANAEPHWLTRPAVFLHTTAIAFWVGALVPLAALVSAGGQECASALKRFSQLIPLPLAALVVTGAILAVIQVEAPLALIETSYGRVLLVKLGLIVALFALAARNRWRLTPLACNGDERAGRLMARAIRIEVLLAALVLGVVALWRFTPPPRVITIEAAKPVTVHIHGEKAMADVSIMPGRIGQVVISVFVMTPAFEPLPAKEVMLNLKAAGIEPFKRPAILVDGVWRVDDLTIPLPGRWTIGLDVLVSDFEETKLDGEVDIQP